MQIIQEKKYIKIIVICFIVLMLILIGIRIYNNTNTSQIATTQKQKLFSSINKSLTVNVTKYSVYGTHFNVEGTLDIAQISGIKINSVDLALKSLNGIETEIKTNYIYKDNLLSFSTFDKMNTAINLESLTPETYFIFLKIAFSNGDVKYYSLLNSTTYNNLTYYSITKNNSNNKIDIFFDKYESIPYLTFCVTKTNNLPDDVYDIAIDPGHGGLDKGANTKEYNESDLVLKTSLHLKNKLEELGLKIYISRDGTENSSEDTANNMYDESGRINLLNNSKAKLMFSLHIKDDLYNKKTGGVEIYAPNNCDFSFASNLANNIVEHANTYYSEFNRFKKTQGVYVRTFTNADVLALESKAKKAGYEPYLINTSTDYFYIIREIGGINTNAYVDGRNKSYGINKYHNSNYGIEGYKIYLGYVDIEQDLTNIVSNYTLYSEAIFNAIQKNYINN